jgi:Domain of unknown function (DUF4276)
VKRILVLVEGQTEERFVNQVLQPHLLQRGLWATATILRTSGFRQPVRKGGVSSWSRMKRDLQRLCEDSNVVAITTLLDYYGLPKDVPGMPTRPLRGTKREQVLHVEAEIDKDIADPRFLAYLSLHELEALLFADVDRWAGRFEHTEISALKAGVGALAPEEINDGASTAPSKRLEQHLTRYRKTLHGPACALEIGLPTLRLRCPHFGDWLGWLEAR